jgi:hypothetical protein
MNNFELDSILDQALDDFEEQDLADRVLKAEQDDESDEEAEREAERERLMNREKMETMMSTLQNPEYGPTLQNTLRSLSTTTEGVETVDQLFGQLAKQFDTNLKPSYMPHDSDDIQGIEVADREVAATLQMIGTAQKGMEGFEAAKMEEVGETVMEDMMAQFEALGEKEDYNEVRVLLVCPKLPLKCSDHRLLMASCDNCYQKISCMSLQNKFAISFLNGWRFIGIFILSTNQLKLNGHTLSGRISANPSTTTTAASIRPSRSC